MNVPSTDHLFFTWHVRVTAYAKNCSANDISLQVSPYRTSYYKACLQPGGGLTWLEGVPAHSAVACWRLLGPTSTNWSLWSCLCCRCLWSILIGLSDKYWGLFQGTISPRSFCCSSKDLWCEEETQMSWGFSVNQMCKAACVSDSL